jgi:tight adherence protein C
MQFLSAVLLFTAIFCGAWGVLTLVGSDRLRRRVRGDAADRDKTRDWLEPLVRFVAPFARWSAPREAWESSPLRLRFFNAGIRHERAVLIYFGLKSLLPVLFGVAAWLALAWWPLPLRPLDLWLIVLLAATVGCYLPNGVLAWLRRRRARELFEAFPDAADLLLVGVEAGLSLDAALARVAQEMPARSPALAQELHLTHLEMRAGIGRDAALHNLGLRCGLEEIRTFAAMLSQAEVFGTRVGDALRVFSDDLRSKRQARAEESAAKISTRMLFPLVLCIFPAIAMVVLGPALIRIVNSLLPMLAGQSVS